MIDLTYRPPYYDPRHALAPVRSEARRKLLQTPDLTEKDLLALLDEDDKTLRTEMGALDPLLMSGEYLPEEEEGEVEIARVVLASTMGDVISIRALFVEDGYTYRVVDEYETAFVHPPLTTEGPLSLGELIGFLDAVRLQAGEDDPLGGNGVVVGWWTRIHSMGTVREESVRFAEVGSEQYPELAAYYGTRADAWTRQS